MEQLENQVEAAIASLPLYDYRIFKADDINLSEAVRLVCEANDCGKYNKSWACPPAVGTLEECKEKLAGYEDCLVFSTAWQPEDILNLDETLALKESHEDVTREAHAELRDIGLDCLVLSSGCDICETCAWPEPCRFPDKAYPSIESYGIVLFEVAERLGMESDLQGGMLLYFSMVFFRKLD